MRAGPHGAAGGGYPLTKRRGGSFDAKGVTTHPLVTQFYEQRFSNAGLTVPATLEI